MPPSQRVQFLGLIIDSKLGRVELPDEKLKSLADLLNNFASRKKVTKKELQVLIGHMSFAAKAIYGARTFMIIFIDAMSKLQKSSHKLRITAVLRYEISWWKSFASTLNGLHPCLLGVKRREITIFTDASLAGFGAYCTGNWLAGTWTAEYRSQAIRLNQRAHFLPVPLLHSCLLQNINFLELISACIAVLVWQSNFGGCSVVIMSDNQPTVSFFNRASTKNLEALV